MARPFPARLAWHLKTLSGVASSRTLTVKMERPPQAACAGSAITVAPWGTLLRPAMLTRGRPHPPAHQQ